MADGDLRQPVALPAFLDGLGDLLQLPAKGSARPRKRASAAARGAPVPLRQTAMVMAFTALVAGTVLAGALGSKPTTRLPAELNGVWRTDDPRYADRRLEITATALAFRAEGAGETRPCPIVRVRHSADADGETFLVDYLQDGAPFQLAFVWRDALQPEIRFANQKDLVWTRAGRRDSTAPSGRQAAPGAPHG